MMRWNEQTRKTRRWRRPGSIYLAVLGVALLVSITGVTALLAARVELRAARLAEDAAHADLLAQSALELGMRLLNTSSTWRTDYKAGTWVALGTLDGATLSFKVVDDEDGSLLDDDVEPVRVYGMAEFNETRRIYSVQLSVIDGEPEELLSNSGFESGTTGWSGYQCALWATSSPSHAGSKSLQVSNRTFSSAGPVQVVSDHVESGTEYQITAWVQPASGTTYAQVDFMVTLAGIKLRSYSGTPVKVTSGTWTEVSATLTPTFLAGLEAISVTVRLSSSTATFYVDDISLIVAELPKELILAPGNWRREVLP